MLFCEFRGFSDCRQRIYSAFLLGLATCFAATALFIVGIPAWGPPSETNGLSQLIAFYLLAAASLNFAILSFLCLTSAPKKPSPSHEGSDQPSPSSSTDGPRLFLLLLVSAGIFAVCLSSPRLEQSLWGDEEWTVRESVLGRFQRDIEPGCGNLDEARVALNWEGLEWQHTAWRYVTTNHHFLYSLLGRSSNRAWQQASGAEDWEFSEAALRFFPFLFGIAGIVLWAFVLRPISVLAAALCAVALSLHPWYLRYMTEARGYGLTFAILPALLLALRSAVRTRRLRHWAAVAVSQCLLVYAWPGMLVFVLGVQASVLYSLRRARARGAEPGASRQWALSNLASCMIMLQVVAPCLPQIWEYLSDELPEFKISWHWFASECSRFILGCDAIDHWGYSETNPLYVTAGGLLQRSPLATGACLLLAPVALVVGIVAWGRRMVVGAATLVGVFGTAVAICVLAILTGTSLYSWYFVPVLPMAVAVAALGTSTLLARIGRSLESETGCRKRLSEAAPAVGATLLLLLFAVTVVPQIRAQNSRSLDPRRESVRRIHGTTEVADPAQLEIITAHCNYPTLSYDPHGWLVKEADCDPESTRPGLVQLMRLADTSGATLWVNIGSADSFERKFPDVAKMVFTDTLFELVERVHGIEPQYERHLYRYRGGMFDFLQGL